MHLQLQLPGQYQAVIFLRVREELSMMIYFIDFWFSIDRNEALKSVRSYVPVIIW
jgi:hypothetical protein